MEAKGRCSLTKHGGVLITGKGKGSFFLHKEGKPVYKVSE